MSFPSMQLTDSGRGIIVKALSGGSIQFTKIQIGNGEEPSNINALTALQNPLKDISITEITTGDGVALLNGQFDNAELTSGFYWKELGVYATDEDLGEVLYAYAYAGDTSDYVPAYSGTCYLKTTLNIAVVVGDATTVSAVIGEYTGYASRASLETHVSDLNNPHQVTKSQIGLGNVENYAFASAPIKFSDTSTLATISSGETIATVFAKVKLAISSLISHLSASNPHSITCTKIGAATSSHVHAASAITSGTLGIARGGTGASTALAAANNILANGATGIGGNLVFADYGDSGARGIQGGMASGDNWRVVGTSTSGDGGILELATNDNGTEPIVARQYDDSDAETDAFTTITRTAYILNASGNTTFPGSCTATSHPTVSDLKKKDVTGELDKDLAKELIMGLTPLCYRFKGSERNRMGFGAQPVFGLLQSLGIEESAVYEVIKTGEEYAGKVLADDEISETDDETLDWTLDYQQLIAPLVAVIQQQQSRIDSLENKMEELTNGIS